MTRRRAELLWLLSLAGFVLLAFLSGCALQQFSPYAEMQMKDEATRQADPSWFGIGQLWIGLKAKF